MSQHYDAVVVGSGPNGLVAAVELARVGLSVLVVEGSDQLGGGCRTAELTLPGFRHDVCSAVHPLAAASPAFADLPLEEHGLRWVTPKAALAHPLDVGPAVLLWNDLAWAAKGLGADGDAWRQLVGPFIPHWDEVAGDLLGPPRLPRHPILAARFGARAVRPALAVARSWFRTERGRALFAGLAGHAIRPLESAGSSAFAVVLGTLAHIRGWPLPLGGASQIASSLASLLRSLGGEIATGWTVTDLDELPRAGAVLLDLSPRGVLSVAGRRLPERYREALKRFRHGPGVFKLDWALAAPIPWKDAACAHAGTVHLGGSLAEIAAAEAAPHAGRVTEHPFVLLAQPSLFDPSRAPSGRHTAWAYCHVPAGSSTDMTAAIEGQVERFAPGFRTGILARHAAGPAELEASNPNLVGGDIGGGANSLGQLYTRPVARLVPYTTPDPALFICSASTPPGGGVHGLCGLHAARAVLARRFGARGKPRS
jgi:phytoene dehydrogenase-like protein